MKKIILFTFLIIFSLGTSRVFAHDPDPKPVVPDKKENRLSEEEINRLSRRNEEISDKDKTPQEVVVVQERRGRGRGHNGMYGEGQRHHGGVIFIGGGSVILLIILIIILV